jgi:hypothetical protein
MDNSASPPYLCMAHMSLSGSSYTRQKLNSTSGLHPNTTKAAQCQSYGLLCPASYTLHYPMSDKLLQDVFKSNLPLRHLQRRWKAHT